MQQDRNREDAYQARREYRAWLLLWMNGTNPRELIIVDQSGFNLWISRTRGKVTRGHHWKYRHILIVSNRRGILVSFKVLRTQNASTHDCEPLVRRCFEGGIVSKMSNFYTTRSLSPNDSNVSHEIHIYVIVHIPTFLDEQLDGSSLERQSVPENDTQTGRWDQECFCWIIGEEGTISRCRNQLTLKLWNNIYIGMSLTISVLKTQMFRRHSGRKKLKPKLCLAQNLFALLLSI